MIFANENLFLIILSLIYIIGAIMQDLRRREVDNIWNFSLLIFALSYRLFYSVESAHYWFFVNGLIGLAITLFLGNLFYYSRVFAGGDAKLLIALGPVLPLSYNWITNLKIFTGFIILFLIAGSVYVFIWSMFLAVKNFKPFYKEFVKSIKKNKKNFYLVLVFEIFLIGFVIIVKEISFLSIGIVVLLFPLLYSYAKAVEEKCMIKDTPLARITEGDWLYKDLKVGSDKIRSSWEGLSKEEISIIRKKHKGNVLIKQGIPFTPSFFFALLIILYLSYRFGWF